MNTRKFCFFTTITILCISILTSNTLSAKNKIGEFHEAPCPFQIPDGLVLGDNFRFGYVNVPEFHSQPNGKTLELAVAIFPSTNKNHHPDPIVMNTSGPGKSNMDNFVPDIAGGLGDFILPYRDVVIIELRGLRYSTPFLMCDEVRQAQVSMMDKNLPTDKTIEILESALKKSKDRFAADGVNLAAFNNVETAADIAMVMSGLGYDKFNIVGSSAGTLVAHHVIRDYPNRVRCAILDAGLPIDPTIFQDMAPNMISMLRQYFKECQNDPECHSAYPNLEKQFLDLVDSMNEEPVHIPIQNPETGININYVLNGYRLSEFVAFSMYFTTQIPALIGKILKGDYSDIEQSVQYRLIPNYFADGLGATIQLSESNNFSIEDIKTESSYKVFSDGVTRAGLGGEYLLAVNDIWNIAYISQERIQYPEQYDVPVLVLNGKYDPVIPSKYDKVMKQHLTNCYIFRFDGVPHSAFDNATECVLPMFLEFLNDPSQAPDSSCMKNYTQKYKVQ